MSKKYFMAFLLIILIIVASTTFTIKNLLNMHSNAKEIAQTWVPNLQLMGWINGAVSDIPSIVLRLTLENNPQEMSRIENEELKPLLKEIQEKLEIYEEHYISNSEEADLYAYFEKNWHEYLDKLPTIIEAGKEKKYDITNRQIKVAYPIWYEANDTINKIIIYNNKKSQRASQSSFNLFEYTILLILFSNLVTILLIVIIVLWTSSNEFRELINLMRRKE
ncbi:MCP four helix bundle domain-containing protein [Desulfotomaculum sp. 1211_IL3151]|uniref:MCP four helix bundle domain-containing protein n=1 Tax=Desulfotomaculum sp. 1211_IL3151 TaxID=3084055 RepID=UPI002FDA4C00